MFAKALSTSAAIRRRPVPRRGFTLIELLIVIAIIALLVSLLLPAMSFVRNQAKKAAAVALLSSIGNGLEQYHSDFQAFPPSSSSAGNFPSAAPFTSGSLMLAEAMTGYLPYAVDGAGPGNTSGVAEPAYGFRAGHGGLGKIYGPYVPPAGATWKCVDTTNQYFAFVDIWGNSILYYRAIPVTLNGQRRSVSQIFSATGTDAYFSVADNSQSKNQDGTTISDPSSASAKFFALMSASSNNLAGGEAVTGKDSYLLVSAGPDGTYFTADDIVAGGK